MDVSSADFGQCADMRLIHKQTDQHDQSHERKDYSDVDGRFGILNFFRSVYTRRFFNSCPLFTLLLFSIMPIVMVRIMDKMGDGPFF